MKVLIFLFYQYLLAPSLFVLLQMVRPFAKGKLREVIEDKNSRFCVEKKAASLIAILRPVWIHAASGEIEYARSLIRELRARHPAIPIVVTYSSPSAKKILAGLDIDAWTVLPWDFSSSFDSFIDQWNPRVLFISRTDVWPVMAASVRRRGIPGFLFSATFAANSSRLKGLTRFLTAHSLEQLNGIFCVTAADAETLSSLRVRTAVQVSGDTRFDQVIHRLNHPQELKGSLRPDDSSRTTIVFGSTWPEDEAVFVPAMAALLEQGALVRFILAPHEVGAAHLEALKAELQKRGLSFCLYSDAASWQAENVLIHVLIVDRVGILAEIYTWGQIAFVGGSFRKQVHSVMEPLAAGLPVLVGPFHLNNREALVYQERLVLNAPLVQVVQDSTEMIQAITRFLTQDLGALQVAIRQEIYKNQGSTERLYTAVKSFLN